LTLAAIAWLSVAAAPPAIARTPESSPAASEDAPPGAASPDGKQESPKKSIELDEAPEPFTPERPATELDRQRVEALSLFAAGRMKEQHEDFAAALRLYQRALRHDPRSLPALRQVVAMAFKLDRVDEAFRYALKTVEIDPSDASMLKQLAALLSARGEYEQALKLVLQAMSLQTDKKSAGYVLLAMESGRLYYLTERPREAADAFSVVMSALDHGAEYGLDARLQKRLLEGRGPDGKSLTTADRTYEMFAEVFLAADRPDAAQAAFEKANAARPDPAVHAYRLARVEAQRKQTAAALESLEKYFAAHDASQGTAPYELLGKLLADSERTDELLPRLERLRAADPQNSPLRYHLAEQYRAAKQFDKAEPLYVEAAAEPPTEGAHQAAAYQGLAAIYSETRRDDSLLELLGEIVDKTGGLEALGEAGKQSVAGGDVPARLAAAARKARQADPNSLGYGACVAVALLALEDKRFDAADEFFNAALKVHRDSAKGLLQTWGIGLLLSDRFEEAAKVFQRGIDERVLPADDPTFHYFLSSAYAMAEKHDEALAAAKHAAVLNDKSIQIAARVPWVLYHSKRYDEAARAYRELIARFDSERSDAVRKELKTARLVLSNIAVIQNDVPQAEEWLEEVLDEYPDDVSAKNDLGYLWADQGKNLVRAWEMARDAVAAEPENAAYRDSLGWALFKLGRYDEALVELKKAVDIGEPDGVILEHLGDAYKAAGQVPLAREAWQRALAHFEKHDEAEKAGRAREKLAADQ